MGVLVNGDGGKSVKYNFYRKAGRSIIERRPVFSPDGESIAIIVENIVRVYNIQTGECVRILETESPVNELIAIQFPENEDYDLYGCSDTGYVTIWTWANGAVLREIKLNLPTNTKVLTFDLIDSTECCIVTSQPNNKCLNLNTYSTKTGQLLYDYQDTKPMYGDMICVALGWCNGDRYAAVSNGTKVLCIQNLQQPHLKTRIVNHNGYRIMSVAAHQKTNAVAITDTLGRATVIRGNLYDYKQVAREVLHWHFLPPLATCFSLQGNYLYTGGMEKVLVKWTIGDLAYRANERNFIPRLPGMIRFITTNNTHVALTLTNNSVVLASAQLRVLGTLLECGGAAPAARAAAALLHVPPLDALLTAARTGHLQLYSTNTDKVLYNLDITGLNNLPSERWNLLPLETEVTCAAVSGNGDWLVTSEYRNDGVTYPEEKLKFWAAQYKNATPFQLNTCVNLSHGGCNIVSLSLNYKGDFCVSAGSDQKFRIWKKENTSSSNKSKKFAWSCLTACYYSSGIGQFISNDVLNGFKDGFKHKPGRDEDLPYLREVDNKNDVIKKLFNIHKEQSLVIDEAKVSTKRDSEFDMGGVAISQDGSLIAAWFGCKLTLWDTHLCNLSTTLSHPALRPKGVHVQFGNRDAAHYLVCTTEKCLAVWSLLSLTVKWLVQINPTCLVSHRFSNKLAVVTTNNDLHVFSPHSSTPVLTKKRLLDPSTGVFKQCTFGTCFDDEIRLYLMRNDSEIYCLEPEKTEESRLEVISHRKLPTSNFSALLAEQQLSEVTPATGDGNVFDVNNLAGSTIAQFSLASPHMVPSVGLLCTTFLQRLSGTEDIEQLDDDAQEDKPMEIDEDSSDDEESSSKLNGPYAPKVTELWTPNYEAVKEKRLNKMTHEPFLDLHSSSSLFGV